MKCHKCGSTDDEHLSLTKLTKDSKWICGYCESSGEENESE